MLGRLENVSIMSTLETPHPYGFLRKEATNQPTELFVGFLTEREGSFGKAVPVKNAVLSLGKSLGNHKKSLRIPHHLRVLESPHLIQSQPARVATDPGFDRILGRTVRTFRAFCWIRRLFFFWKMGSLNTQKVGNIKRKMWILEFWIWKTYLFIYIM